MSFSTNRKYIPEVDQLRALAVMLVLFYHGLQLFGAQLVHHSPFDASRHWLYPSNPILAIIEEGHSGVSLFIVLSGFILSIGTIGRLISYRLFLTARALRIYPLMIVFLVVGASANPSNITSVLTSALPLNVAGGVGGTFTAMFWAVAVEFQCYLVFPLLISLSNERGSKFLIQVIAVAVLMRCLVVFSDGANPRDLSYWTVVGRIDQFCIGIVVARAYVLGGVDKVRPWWFLLASSTVGVSLAVFNCLGGWPAVGAWKVLWPTFEGAMWGTFILTYIAAARLLPRGLAWICTKLGEISYSMYLVHFPVVFAVINHRMFVQVTGNGHYDALLTTLIVVLPVVIALATLTYRTIELPFLRMRPRYVMPRLGSQHRNGLQLPAEAAPRLWRPVLTRDQASNQ
jgi:peptidoglycan/LPS O-acetylase OafA/YrhL